MAAPLRFSPHSSEAGIASLNGEPDFLELTEPVRIIDGASVYEAYPSDHLELDVTIEFPHPLIGKAVARIRRHEDLCERSCRGRGLSVSCTRSMRCGRRG